MSRETEGCVPTALAWRAGWLGNKHLTFKKSYKVRLVQVGDPEDHRSQQQRQMTSHKVLKSL